MQVSDLLIRISQICRNVNAAGKNIGIRSLIFVICHKKEAAVFDRNNREIIQVSAGNNMTFDPISLAIVSCPVEKNYE